MKIVNLKIVKLPIASYIINICYLFVLVNGLNKLFKMLKVFLTFFQNVQ